MVILVLIKDENETDKSHIEGLDNWGWAQYNVGE